MWKMSSKKVFIQATLEFLPHQTPKNPEAKLFRVLLFKKLLYLIPINVVFSLMKKPSLGF
jgi:hypothetical protein